MNEPVHQIPTAYYDKGYKLKGVPDEYYEVFKVFNEKTGRSKMKFVCKYDDKCNKVFNKSCNLKTHFVKHSKLSKFECRLCNVKFTQNGSLVRHMKNIHKEEIQGTSSSTSLLGKRTACENSFIEESAPEMLKKAKTD